MKRLFAFLMLFVFIAGCDTLMQLIKKDNDFDSAPLVISNEENLRVENLETAAVEGKIIEGMSTHMVEQSWGIPDSTKFTETGLMIWEYRDSKLFFLDDILIGWEDKK